MRKDLSARALSAATLAVSLRDFAEALRAFADASGAREDNRLKPYKVLTISMYRRDVAELDAKVERLKASGRRKMSRSALIRYALSLVDPEKVPPGVES